MRIIMTIVLLVFNWLAFLHKAFPMFLTSNQTVLKEQTTKMDLIQHMLKITLEYLSGLWINLAYNFPF